MISMLIGAAIGSFVCIMKPNALLVGKGPFGVWISMLPYSVAINGIGLLELLLSNPTVEGIAEFFNAVLLFNIAHLGTMLLYCEVLNSDR